MISGLIPHRYAKALFKFAGTPDKQEHVYREMEQLSKAFASTPDFQKVLANPHISYEDKKSLLLKAVGEKPGEDYCRFVTLILDHKREEFAYLMALAYREIYRKANNISQVKITTAVSLGQNELDKLEGLVTAKFPSTNFETTFAVDPELIGGFVIDVDSTRLNASISSELEQLRQQLISK